MTPKQILRKTYEFFLDREWGQGSYDYAAPPGGTHTHGCFCLTGAVSRVCMESKAGDHREEAFKLLCNHLNLVPQEIAEAKIISWNDTPGRTKAEVLSALLGASQ